MRSQREMRSLVLLQITVVSSLVMVFNFICYFNSGQDSPNPITNIFGCSIFIYLLFLFYLIYVSSGELECVYEYSGYCLYTLELHCCFGLVVSIIRNDWWICFPNFKVVRKTSPWKCNINYYCYYYYYYYYIYYIFIFIFSFWFTFSDFWFWLFVYFL
jgi:hypothetical protein